MSDELKANGEFILKMAKYLFILLGLMAITQCDINIHITTEQIESE